MNHVGVPTNPKPQQISHRFLHTVLHATAQVYTQITINSSYNFGLWSGIELVITK